MPHEDGAAYYPVVATVSLGGSVALDVVSKTQNAEEGGGRKWRIFQEPRSLLVTTDPAYSTTLHGIVDVVEDVDLTSDTVANWELLGESARLVANGGQSQRSTRVSLTYRDVKKVSTLGGKLFGKSKT